MPKTIEQIYDSLLADADASWELGHATRAADRARAIKRRQSGEPEYDHGVPWPVSEEG
jgi:hypothetical protein